MSETAMAPPKRPRTSLRPSSAPTGREQLAKRLPFGVMFAVALGAPLVLTPEYVDITGQALIAVIGAVGLNLLTGYTGQLSLGHAGLFAMSGFVAGVLSNSMGVPFPLNIIAGMVAGGVIGLILGLPSLRLRGLYLVLATVAFHFIAVYLVTAYQSSRSGFVAISGITLDQPTFGPLVIDSVTKWYYLLLVIAVLVALFAWNLVRTRPGRAWVAVRHGELVASALGVNVLRHKLSAFVVSSVMAALAGGLLVQYAGSVAAETYTFELAVAYLVMIIVGGLGSITGAIIGAFVVTMSPEIITTVLTWFNASSTFQSNYLIPLQVVIYGLLLVAFLLFEPSGLVGVGRRFRRALDRRRRS